MVWGVDFVSKASVDNAGIAANTYDDAVAEMKRLTTEYPWATSALVFNSQSTEEHEITFGTDS
jgi:hypothetical protein